MSAFLCSAEHLSALVNYAAAHTRAGCCFKLLPSTDPRRVTDADQTFNALRDENLKSLGARYGEGKITDWMGQPFGYRFKLDLLKVWKPIDIIKLCHCYAYQACEHDGWETSEVKRWIDAVERHAIGHLPGYETAPWGL